MKSLNMYSFMSSSFLVFAQHFVCELYLFLLCVAIVDFSPLLLLHHNLFIHLGCFQFETIMNKTAMNVLGELYNNFFLKTILFILFLERREEREKHPSVASHMTQTGELARNASMCPDQESNQ